MLGQIYQLLSLSFFGQFLIDIKEVAIFNGRVTNEAFTLIINSRISLDRFDGRFITCVPTSDKRPGREN
ncbi:hypothetical protein EM82_023085 [Vibrio parahaemolyticus]|nr:hypothetical protein EM82_023085 [Vibrio parahaemolyticus]